MLRGTIFVPIGSPVRSGFILFILFILILGGLGAGGYFAYTKGYLDTIIAKFKKGGGAAPKGGPAQPFKPFSSKLPAQQPQKPPGQP